MLSGVGPADHLRGQGVEVVVPLSGVGANLQDHPGVPLVLRAARPVPFGANQGSELALYCHLPASGEGATPDLQYGFINTAVVERPEDQLSGSAFSLYPSLLQPRSRGTIRLADAEPTAPVIDPAYLSDQDDLRRLLAALRVSRELVGMPSLRGWVEAEHLPGSQHSTTTDLERYVQASVNTWFHPVGTCRMGVDDLAVVDPSLRVHCLVNVRVADASVMPEITSGNTHAPTTIIAWRAADLVRHLLVPHARQGPQRWGRCKSARNARRRGTISSCASSCR
jgi:choline dehydrogenase